MKRKPNLERKVEGHRRIVTNNTAAITSPQRENALFPDSTGYAIKHALESATPTRHNGQIAFLSLQQQLRPLNWGNNRVHHTAHQRPSHQIALEILHTTIEHLILPKFQSFPLWVIVLCAHPSIPCHRLCKSVTLLKREHTHQYHVFFSHRKPNPEQFISLWNRAYPFAELCQFCGSERESKVKMRKDEKELICRDGSRVAWWMNKFVCYSILTFLSGLSWRTPLPTQQIVLVPSLHVFLHV